MTKIVKIPESRDSTIIYRSFYEAIIELPEISQAEIWRSIFEYSLNFKKIELTGLSKTIFTLIKPQLDANIRKFENGKKGGRPPIKPKQPKTNPEPGENLNQTNKEANENANSHINENNNENANQSNAYEILKRDMPYELELFENDNRNKINEGYDNLITRFNNQIQLDFHQGKIALNANQLMPKLRLYTDSWIRNQLKENVKTEEKAKVLDQIYNNIPTV